MLLTFRAASLTLAGLAAALLPPAAGALAEEAAPDRPLAATDVIAPPRHGPLTAAETEMARLAWTYFVNNTQASTGLANAVAYYPSTTLWDTASYLAAVVSAEGLGIIDAEEAEARLDRALGTLQSLELFRQDCPNKVYNTETATPADYRNEPGEIGCSALDIGRLLVWLRIVEQRFPREQPLVRAILPRWDWCGLLRDGVLNGAVPTGGGGVGHLQEGRLGYEEYAARAFELWGFEAEEAIQPEPFDTLVLYGVEIPFDARDPRQFGAHTYVVTESYALWGLEFGWDDPAGHAPGAWVARAAQNIYLAQERRHAATGILTARTEHQLLDAPYFVYDTIYSDGEAWATITDRGDSVPEAAAVSVKGALGLWALWDTPYTDRLFAAVAGAFDPAQGYYEGLFEADGAPVPVQTANNNGILLETLLFKVEGPLLRPVADPSGWASALDPEAGRCLPGQGEGDG